MRSRSPARATSPRDRTAGGRLPPSLTNDREVFAIIKPFIEEEYGANNPEPLAMKDSAKVRDPSKDSLHAALEYIEGIRAGAESRQEQ